MTDGRQGHQFTHLRGEELVETRRAEAYRAAELLGVEECVFLDNPDTRLWTCRGVRVQVHELLVRIRPDVVYLPAFTDTHTDHLHTFLAVADAAAMHEPETVYFMFETWSPLVANCVIAIDMEQKLDALRAHASQLGTHEAFLPAVRALARYRALTCLLDADGYAEAFWRTDSAGLLQLAQWLR